jgi:hypothetical protein
MSNPNISLEILDALRAQTYTLNHLVEVIEDLQRQLSGKPAPQEQKTKEAAPPQALPQHKEETKKSSPWQQQKGKKGIFELRTDIDTNEYLTLRDEIWKENGKLAKDGFFYWIMQNEDGIGRKPLRK